MKKIVIALLFIGVIFVAGLWWVGGQTQTLEDKTPAVSSPTTNTGPVWKLDKSALTLQEDEGGAAWRAYGTRLGQALNAYTATSTTSGELNLALELLDAPSAQGVAAIRAVRERHLTAAESLTATMVPVSGAQAHLNLTNSILGLAEIDFYLEQILLEPTIALEQGAKYPERYAAFLNAIEKLNRFFVERGITFRAEEQAKIFIKP